MGKYLNLLIQNLHHFNKRNLYKIILAFFLYKFARQSGKFLSVNRTEKYWQKKIDQHLEKRKIKHENYLKQVNAYNLNLREKQIEDILESSVSQLKEKLEKMEVTSVQLLFIFMKRCLEIGLKYNYITEFNFEEALEMAQNYDQLRLSNPEQCKGELFGIPVSIKDCLIQKGSVCTVGLASRLNKFEKEDGLALILVKQAGGIPFVRSNIPQILLAPFTSNNVYGTSLNPWNINRTCGGSSGGEAGLLSSRCSPIGVGTDIGGSIRYPCVYTGLVGFKPGNHRLTSMGSFSRSVTLKGNGTISTQIGPMAKYVDDNVEYMKAVLNQQYYDNIPLSKKPLDSIMQWNQEEFESKKKMKIGYYTDMEDIQVSICVQRAIDECIEILRNQGHELVPIEMNFANELANTYKPLMLADGGAEIRRYSKGESLLQFYKNFMLICGLSGWQRSIITSILDKIGQKQTAAAVRKLGVKSAHETKDLIGNTYELQKKYTKLYEDNQLDAIISPVAVIPAPCNDKQQSLHKVITHSIIQNVTQFPSGTVPITKVREDEQHYLNVKDKSNLENKLIHQNMIDSVGIPVGVQITTLPQQEEKCLNLMKQIENKVQFWKNHGLKI